MTGGPRNSISVDYATAADGRTIAVHCVAAEGVHEPAVVMTHGTFSDARVCIRLARHIAKAGFACFVFEWNAHGRSSAGVAPPTFESVALEDVAPVLALVRRRTGRARVLWVGHSGGGFLPFMAHARDPALVACIEGVAALGSQAFGAGRTLRARAGIAASALLTNALGRTPGRSLRLGSTDESKTMMNDWFRWNWTGRWLSRDGFDYAAALARVTTPTLLLAGAGDRFIAPPAGCRALFERLGASDKSFVVCGRTTGFAEDYTHAGLVTSRRATRDVWPLVTEWLVARAATGPRPAPPGPAPSP